MEYTSCHPLLVFTREEMLEQRKELGLHNENQLRNDIAAILEWFNKQPHLAPAGIDADTIERMIILAKGSIERTKQRIESLYTLRQNAPELILNRDTHDPQNDSYWTWSRTVMIPRLYGGKRISVIQVKFDDSQTLDYTALFKIGFMIGDLRLKNDYSNGDIYIVDLANIHFTHLAKLQPLLMRKAEIMYHEGYGARLCNIHVLNAPSFLDRLLFIIKQTIKPKITNRILIHNSVEELQQHIPKELLPSDYGGFGKSLEELAEMWRNDMRSPATRQFFLESEKKMSDESARVGGAKLTEASAEWGGAGSFRKLELD